jgi:hypothetical protein
MQSISGLRRRTEGLTGHEAEDGDNERKTGTRYDQESAAYTEAGRGEDLRNEALITCQVSMNHR